MHCLIWPSILLVRSVFDKYGEHRPISLYQGLISRIWTVLLSCSIIVNLFLTFTVIRGRLFWRLWGDTVGMYHLQQFVSHTDIIMKDQEI